MARSEVSRKLIYYPSKIGGKEAHVEISRIERTETVSKIGHIHEGKTMIMIKDGPRRYTVEKLCDIDKAIQEGLNG